MKFLLITTLLLLSMSGYSQSIQEFKVHLAQSDSVYGSRVEVIEHGDAAALVRGISQVNSDLKVKGYRVGIYTGNGQNARSMAEATMSRFREMFGGTPAYMKYENPDWKVSVGNCVTIEEAITLWGRVKNSFNRAFIIREEIPILVLSE